MFCLVVSAVLVCFALPFVLACLVLWLVLFLVAVAGRFPFAGLFWDFPL